MEHEYYIILCNWLLEISGVVMLQSPMSFHYVSTGEMNNFYRKLAQQRKESIIEDRPMTLDVSFVLDILQYRVGLKLFVLHPNNHKVIDSYIVKKIMKVNGTYVST